MKSKFRISTQHKNWVLTLNLNVHFRKLHRTKKFKEAVQFASSHGKFETCQIKPGSMIITVIVYQKTIQVFATGQ